MNLLGAELSENMKAEAEMRLDSAEPGTENGNFKVAVARNCIGKGTMRTATPGTPDTMDEIYYSLMTMKLEAYKNEDVQR